MSKKRDKKPRRTKSPTEAGVTTDLELGRLFGGEYEAGYFERRRTSTFLKDGSVQHVELDPIPASLGLHSGGSGAFDALVRLDKKGPNGMLEVTRAVRAVRRLCEPYKEPKRRPKFMTTKDIERQREEWNLYPSVLRAYFRTYPPEFFDSVLRSAYDNAQIAAVAMIMPRALPIVRTWMDEMCAHEVSKAIEGKSKADEHAIVRRDSLETEFERMIYDYRKAGEPKRDEAIIKTEVIARWAREPTDDDRKRALHALAMVADGGKDTPARAEARAAQRAIAEQARALLRAARNAYRKARRLVDDEIRSDAAAKKQARERDRLAPYRDVDIAAAERD